MRKRCLMLLFTLAIIGLSKSVAQNYRVQIAAFPEKIDHSFFYYAGFPNVHAEKSSDNFIRYSLDRLYSLAEAKKIRQKAKDVDLMNTQIIPAEEPIYAAYKGDLAINTLPKERLYIRSIHFESEQLSLEEDAKRRMEEVFGIMQKHPELKLRIIAHKDKSASQRARMLRNYLLANGIPAYRLKIKTSEADTPESLANHEDFLNKNKKITLALVDLKEEIVTDSFDKNTEYLSNVQQMSGLMKLMKLV